MGKGIIKGEIPMKHWKIVASFCINGAPSLKINTHFEFRTQINYIFDTGNPEWHKKFISLNFNLN